MRVFFATGRTVAYRARPMIPLAKRPPDPFPPNPALFPPPLLEKTEPFCVVYEDVTAAIRNYEDEKYLGPFEYSFIEFLIDRFFLEYQQWIHAPAIHYLNRWHGKSNGKAYRLIGQAYLHMAWDLPRTIADFWESPRMISDIDAELHFTNLNRLFQDVYHKNFKKWSVAGWISLPAKLFGQRAAIIRVGTSWVISVRMTAWSLGRILGHQASQRDRDSLEQRLWNSVQEEADKIANGKLNPIGWAGMISPPSLWNFAPVVAGIAVNGGWKRLAGYAIALVALYLFGVYRGTVQVARSMGDGLLSAMIKIMEDGQRSMKIESNE